LTAIAVPARGDRWLRAFFYGLLAEVATIVTIIAIVLLYRYVLAKNLTDADYAAFGMRTGEMVGIIGGTLYTFLFARLVTRGLPARRIAHGIVVALAAIALSVGGSLAGHHGLPAGYVLATLLKLAAGALAGFLAGTATGSATTTATATEREISRS
jgi:hypothetical protein